ncbi:transporter [Floricoccus tropicus]|uniref:Transporter n=1 Tax=Floricoccus tropicus TaxID=1859473 RepID=A0A1E8GJZ3_9LACT|nr:MFS transporter [Floricoccus tropicus]OFI48507.1 transporter [Floricoccus tropicus]
MSFSQTIMNKIGFKDKKKFLGFLTVVSSGQIIYSAFEAFKGTFYNTLLEVFNLSNAQLGTILGALGISTFLYIPGGWINNRFSTRSLLITGMLVRFLTINYMLLFTPGFEQLKFIAMIWGVVDAFFWPAVLNGVILTTNESNRSIGFGLLESVRRALEVLMNFILVTVMSVAGGLAIFKGGMFVYNLLLIPLCFLVMKYIPKNGISAEHEGEGAKAADALKGLIAVMLKPKVWLASLSALTVYWCYIILIYTVPYLQAVYKINSSQAALFGIFNTGVMGIICGVLAGYIASKVLKSSSLLMGLALLVTAASLGLTLIVPKTKEALLPAVIVLFLFSFSIFLAKSIILAPVAELDIDSRYSGSAMSVGSFLAYAPVLLVYSMNGRIIDNNLSDPVAAYKTIFLIGVGVALFGAFCSFVLVALSKKSKAA